MKTIFCSARGRRVKKNLDVLELHETRRTRAYREGELGDFFDG